MKKLFSFLTLFMFLFIGFIHNSMMVFAVESNVEMNVGENSICCGDKIGKNENTNCMQFCCIEGDIGNGVSSFNNNFQKKVFKAISNIVINVNIITLYSLGNKSLVNKIPPPYFDREITNYSYHTLIKVIKSNT